MNNHNMKCKCGKSVEDLESFTAYDGMCHDCYVKYGMTDNDQECYFNQREFQANIDSKNREILYSHFVNEQNYVHASGEVCPGCASHLCADCVDFEPEEPVINYIDADGDVCSRPAGDGYSVLSPVNSVLSNADLHKAPILKCESVTGVSLLSRSEIEASIKLRGQSRSAVALAVAAIISILGSVLFIHSAFAYVSPMERCQQVSSFDTCFTTLHR